MHFPHCINTEKDTFTVVCSPFHWSTDPLVKDKCREREGGRASNEPAHLQQYLADCWLGTVAGDAHLWLNSAQPAWHSLDQSDSRAVNACFPAPFPLHPPWLPSTHPHPFLCLSISGLLHNPTALSFSMSFFPPAYLSFNLLFYVILPSSMLIPDVLLFVSFLLSVIRPPFANLPSLHSQISTFQLHRLHISSNPNSIFISCEKLLAPLSTSGCSL